MLLVICSTGCERADATNNQPIAFPHKLHTENQIDCVFCHEFVERSASAGIPQTELCSTCHAAMEQNSPETVKLMEYAEAEKPIPWVRLYDLPAYSYFPHKWHIRADITCDECHGNIGESLTAVQHKVLDMEWCIDCHTQREAPVDCLTCHK